MTLQELFEREGEVIVSELRKSFDRNRINASGRLRDSLLSEATKDSLIVSGADYVFNVEDGTPPTKSGRPTYFLQRSILKWLDDKGIPEWQGRTRDQQAWVISNKIAKEGSSLFRSGGNSGVLSDVINEKLLDSIAAKALRETELNFLTGTGLSGSTNGISNI